MRLGSDDMHRVLKEGLFMILCYSLYIALFGLLAIKFWIKIR
jgi:hypothetical protein